MGYGHSTYEEVKNEKAFLETMKKHPNYKKPIPFKNESKTRFILRAVGELISPEQEEDESYDLECISIRKAILYLETELEEIWLNHNKTS